jgi:hypothetical protein
VVVLPGRTNPLFACGTAAATQCRCAACDRSLLRTVANAFAGTFECMDAGYATAYAHSTLCKAPASYHIDEPGMDANYRPAQGR